MTLDKARELLQSQTAFSSDYNRNTAKLILAEINRQHGQRATDRLIIDLNLEEHFGFQPGSKIII